MKKIYPFTALGLLISQPSLHAALAQGNHFSIGGRMGYEMLIPMSSLSLPDTGLNHNGGFMWGVEGSYQIDYKKLLLGLEVGVRYSADLSHGMASNGIESELSMLDIPVLATVQANLPFIKKTAVAVKAGAVYSKQKCSNCAGCLNGCFRAISTGKVLPMAAIELKRRVSESVDIDFQYSQAFGTSWDSGYAGNHGSDVLTHGAFTLGLTYRFM